MATLANMFNRFSVAATAAEAVGTGVRLMDESCRLRALPNEDVYFYIKRIDNSRVVRQADPLDRSRDRKVVAGGILAAALLIGTLLPSAFGLIAGYQLNQLRTENARLINERAKLELEEARLVSPERLQALAVKFNMSEPTPDSVEHVNGQDGALALSRQ